ncbi:MAG TPA: phospholipase D-like domain-containing protein [Polyangiales bacterium]|nr:phospholipase D-like domain-containing protein [Polyangiales bacterium]
MPIRRSKLPIARDGNRVTLFHDGGACLAAMYQAIEAAQREILLEMYWFGSDKTGHRFALALEERARAGVKVCVIYDAVGSWESDSAQFTRLREAGCDVHVYNPVRRWLFRLGAGNRRDHRKLLVVDGQIGMTGGVNLADPWAPIADGGGGFRDNLVRIEGPAVADMRAIFATLWPHRLPVSAVPAPAGDVSVRVLANDRRKQRRRIERAYLFAIRSARRRVLIENSYFVPSWFVRTALRRAAKRGVDVSVVLPSVSDVPLVKFASHRSYEHLLQAGVKLYEWGHSVLHSKIAVVDDWCTVGTHNLDYRSWLYNLEINVSMVDAGLARELGERIGQAIVVSERIDPKQWALRPLLHRWLERLLYRFRRLL